MPEKDKKIEDRIADIESSLEEYYNLNRIIWDRNLLKKKGHWWIEINNDSRWTSSRKNYTQLDPRYPTPATDFYFSQAQAIESNIIKGFPLPYAKARVRTDKAKRAAKFNDILIKYYWENLLMRDAVGKISGWCLDTGGCIGIPYWDMNKGQKIQLPKTKEMDDVEEIPMKACKACGTFNPVEAQICMNQECNRKNGRTDMIPQTISKPVKRKQMVLDDFGNPMIEEVSTGDAAFEISPYYEWLFDPFAEELEQCSFVMRRRAKSIDWIKSVHKGKAANVQPDSAAVEDYWYVARINGWVSGGVQLSYDSRTFLYHYIDNVAPYVEYWQKPVGPKDKGRYVVMSGKTKLEDKEFPWDDGQYHFIHFRYSKAQGSFYGESLANKIVPINDRLNRIDQHIIWNRHMVIDPIIVNPANSKVPNSDFYGRLGRIVNPMKDNIPTLLAFPGLPQQVYEERSQCVADMDKIGVSDPMQGSLPQGRTPAYSVELSIEQSNNKLSQFAFYLSEGMKKWAKETSSLAKQFLSGPRKFDIQGDNDEYEVEAFSGMELQGDENVENGGVLVEHNFDTVYPKSRASEKQTMIDLLQFQAINPQEPFVSAVIMEKFGFDDEINTPFNADKAAAEREIVDMEQGRDVSAEYAQMGGIDIRGLQMMQGQLVMADPNTGQPIPVDPHQLLRQGENAMIHFEIHRQDLQKEAFDKLPPEVQQRKRQHFQFTTMAMQMDRQQQMMEQAQMAMIQKGSPAPQKQNAA